jgi:hypothetical protein
MRAVIPIEIGIMAGKSLVTADENKGLRWLL